MHYWKSETVTMAGNHSMSLILPTYELWVFNSIFVAFHIHLNYRLKEGSKQVYYISMFPTRLMKLSPSAESENEWIKDDYCSFILKLLHRARENHYNTNAYKYTHGNHMKFLPLKNINVFCVWYSMFRANQSQILNVV